MATQTIEFLAVTGQAVTAKLFTVGSDTEVASVSATEATNRKGLYSAAYTNVAAGTYDLIAFVSTTPVARWQVVLALTTATFQAYEPVATEPIADAVWDESMADHTGSTTYGGRIVRANNSNVTVQITGANHIAADVHEFQPDVFDADAIAASAVTELQAGLASETTLSALLAKFAGITLLKNWLALIMGKTADTTTRAEVNATTAGATYNETTDALEAIRDRGDAAWITGSSGSGSGARTVVVTVNDGTNPLQNATVRLTEGANTYLGTTDVNGQTTFNVDDATYSVAVTKSGYSFAGTTLLVNGNETLTASMSAITITPGTGSLTTGFMTILSDSGAEAAGVIVSLQMTDLPDGDEGFGYDRSVRTSTSSASGLVEFEGMVKGATYQIWRGARKHASLFTVPAGAGTTYEIPSLLGE